MLGVLGQRKLVGAFLRRGKANPKVFGIPVALFRPLGFIIHAPQRTQGVPAGSVAVPQRCGEFAFHEVRAVRRCIQRVFGLVVTAHRHFVWYVRVHIL